LNEIYHLELLIQDRYINNSDKEWIIFSYTF